MPFKNKEDKEAYRKEYDKLHPDKRYLTLRYSQNEMKWRLRQKEEVLAHYGKCNNLECCWEGCGIVDIDILTLDHINNNGAEERRKFRRTGSRLYRWLKLSEYPEGFQTLCMNHQFKKEILRRREVSAKRFA